MSRGERLAAVEAERDDLRAKVAAVGAPMTTSEQRDIAQAFERDKWAGEWNSLPTAIDRMMADRAALATPPTDTTGGAGDAQ